MNKRIYYLEDRLNENEYKRCSSLFFWNSKEYIIIVPQLFVNRLTEEFNNSYIQTDRFTIIPEEEFRHEFLDNSKNYILFNFNFFNLKLNGRSKIKLEDFIEIENELIVICNDKLLTEILSAINNYDFVKYETGLLSMHIDKETKRRKEISINFRKKYGNSQMIIGKDSREQLIKDLIEVSEQEVILACPWWNFNTCKKYIKEIKDAADRGVSIFLYYGIIDINELDEKNMNTKATIERLKLIFIGYNDIKFIEKNFHLKVGIADKKLYFNTSENYMSLYSEPWGEIFDYSLINNNRYKEITDMIEGWEK